MGEEKSDIRPTAERRLAGEAFEQHTAERVNVRSAVDNVAPDLFRGDVVHRSHQLAVLARHSLLRDSSCEPEIGEVHMICALGAGFRCDENVRRLDVTVHEVARVGRVEGPPDLRDERERLLWGEGALSEKSLQRRPGHVAH